ncbi:uncharacterized protein LOC110098688 [Dendrobium catenatum]|uniref:E3 ubiquitin-protein ligase ZSWIM2 n=1 Tax=Dendrobium catenatum TaxID=906689 RepID=A0A2I0WLE6_9ASPA|nr:uncharacterized protein LOC110098688 [Dendrobium catenatum]PKU76468.1 E3 ubiquitin-protein ligase ZSWIM2 [Dendrobium catenatum]
MESVSSNDSPSPFSSPRLTINPRISRALYHPLLLLHRSGQIFHILGSTSNVYTVTLSQTPTCSCPDPTIPCKHILFIILRVLRLPVFYPSLLRRSLPPSLLSRLLSSPTNRDSLANPRVLHRFRQLFFLTTATTSREGEENRSLGLCPICLEEMEVEIEGRVLRCGVCGNGLHKECWGRWKSIRGKRGASCVICRARWTRRRVVDRYLNLAEVAREEEVVAMNGSDGSSICGEVPPG